MKTETKEKVESFKVFVEEVFIPERDLKTNWDLLLQVLTAEATYLEINNLGSRIEHFCSRLGQAVTEGKKVSLDRMRVISIWEVGDEFWEIEI
jgi:hypothetical protein